MSSTLVNLSLGLGIIAWANSCSEISCQSSKLIRLILRFSKRALIASLPALLVDSNSEAIKSTTSQESGPFVGMVPEGPRFAHPTTYIPLFNNNSAILCARTASFIIIGIMG